MTQVLEVCCPHCARMQVLMNQTALLADLYRMKCEELQRRLDLPGDDFIVTAAAA